MKMDYRGIVFVVRVPFIIVSTDDGRFHGIAGLMCPTGSAKRYE